MFLAILGEDQRWVLANKMSHDYTHSLDDYGILDELKQGVTKVAKQFAPVKQEAEEEVRPAPGLGMWRKASSSHIIMGDSTARATVAHVQSLQAVISEAK